MAMTPDQLLAALTSDEPVTALKALRDHLASEIAGGVAARDLAALSTQYRAVNAELAAIAAPKSKSPADELKDRRAARRAGAKTPRSAKG